MSTPSHALERPPAASPARSTSPSRVPGAWRARIGAVIPKGLQLAAVAAIALALVALSYGMNHMSYIIWGALWVAPVLLILSLPIANRAARLDGDAIGRIVLVAAAVKILGASLLRYWMAYSVYGGVADSARYHQAGVVLAPFFRDGVYSDLGRISGTRFIEVLTGQIYAFTGATRLGGFMIFSWFGFVGCYLFYRAFRIAYPDGDSRRYALLVFFFPTLWFWPSSIGKEAFMTLVLGALALAAAQLFVGRLRGLLWLALGLWGAAVVRPHMALIVGAGLAAAVPVAVLRGRSQAAHGRLGGLVLIFALLVAGSALVGVAEKFFKLDSLNAESAQQVLDETTRRTGEAGSSFNASSPNNPLGFAVAGATVLFRPFPFEAHNLQATLASLEGLSLGALCLLSLRRLARLPVILLRRPYVTFCVVYTFAFIYAFSALANFGVLARERSQLLPLLFVALCIQGPGRTSSEDGEPASTRKAEA